MKYAVNSRPILLLTGVRLGVLRSDPLSEVRVEGVCNCGDGLLQGFAVVVVFSEKLPNYDFLAGEHGEGCVQNVLDLHLAQSVGVGGVVVVGKV